LTLTKVDHIGKSKRKQDNPSPFGIKALVVLNMVLFYANQ